MEIEGPASRMKNGVRDKVAAPKVVVTRHALGRTPRRHDAPRLLLPAGRRFRNVLDVDAGRGLALTHSQWLIKGKDVDCNRIEVHHHGMEVHRKLPDGTWAFLIDHPFGADPSWAETPPRTD